MIVKWNDQDAALDAAGHEVIVALRDTAELELLQAALYACQRLLSPPMPPDDAGVIAVRQWVQITDNFLTEERDNG